MVGEDDSIDGGVWLNERRAGEAGDWRLRSRLNGGRACGEIELREARGARGAGAAFAAQTYEDGLRAGGSDACGAGIQETGDSAHEHFGGGGGIGIDQVDALRAEISDDQLSSIGSEGESAQSSIGRWAGGRGEGSGVELHGGEIEDVDVVGGGKIEPLALLVVEHEFVECGLGENLQALQVLKRARRGRGSGGRVDDDVGLALRAWGS